MPFEPVLLKTKDVPNLGKFDFLLIRTVNVHFTFAFFYLIY